MIAAVAVLLLAQAPNPDLERFESARKMQAEGRCAEAIPVLTELVRAHPGVAAIGYLLGRCYFDTRDYRAARPLLGAAVAAEPASAEARFFLGSALGLAGQVPEAIEQLEAATRLDPNFAPAFRVLGMFRFESGQFVPETRAALETAVRLDPSDGRAEYWLGRFAQEMREYEAARAHLERALSLAPESLQARLAYGQVLAALGDDRGALAAFDAVLAAEPASAAALMGRAKCLYAAQQPAQAAAAAEAALKNAAGPDLERDANWLLSRIYRDLERATDAEAAERRLAALDDARERRLARFRELQERARKLSAGRRIAELVEVLEESVKIQERRDSLVMLGDAYMELGRVAEAENCFLRALQAGPASAPIARRLQILRERYKEKR